MRRSCCEDPGRRRASNTPSKAGTPTRASHRIRVYSAGLGSVEPALDPGIEPGVAVRGSTEPSRHGRLPASAPPETRSPTRQASQGWPKALADPGKRGEEAEDADRGGEEAGGEGGGISMSAVYQGLRLLPRTDLAVAPCAIVSFVTDRPRARHDGRDAARRSVQGVVGQPA